MNYYVLTLVEASRNYACRGIRIKGRKLWLHGAQKQSIRSDFGARRGLGDALGTGCSEDSERCSSASLSLSLSLQDTDGDDGASKL